MRKSKPAVPREGNISTSRKTFLFLEDFPMLEFFGDLFTMIDSILYIVENEELISRSIDRSEAVLSALEVEQ